MQYASIRLIFTYSRNEFAFRLAIILVQVYLHECFCHAIMICLIATIEGRTFPMFWHSFDNSPGA